MNNFIFENSTKVYFGKACVKEYLACLVADAKTVMLAYGSGAIKKAGIYDAVVEILKAADKSVVEFSGIMPNPTYEKVQQGAALARSHKVDMILGVGGGSVMDCCKAVSLAAVYDGDIWQDFWAQPGVIACSPLPLGVIVTAAGTGSECNGGAVITNTTTKVKTGKDYPKLNPRFALLDPELTLSVPDMQMRAGSFDTLSHIMEIYFSGPDDDNISDDLAEALMRGVIRDLRVAARNPFDYAARSNLMWAATMAENRILKLGKATDFQAHMMEHQLGAYTDCNHGQGLAVLHPPYYRHICARGAKKFARFAVRVWDIDAAGKTEHELAREGVEALADFIKELGLPTSLKALGVTEETPLKEIADSVVLTSGGYGKLSRDEVLEIFKACY